MARTGTTEHVDTVIIGGGQAGLATGYHLARRGRPFVILEAHQRVGDIWRHRFDSLRLYSPTKYDGLPGMAIAKQPWSWPTKDEMAGYLESYADRFQLPVRTGVHVRELSKTRDGYAVACGDVGFEAANVVVATGGWQAPWTPAFAAELEPTVRQLHSHDYRNPSQLQAGTVLVVGTSHSGADIALEVAASHATVACGPVRGEVPFDIEGAMARIAVPILWFAANHLLTQRTPIGRSMRPHVRREGGPLLRVKRADLAEAGVEHVEAKVVGVRDGKPELDGGRVVDAQNVIWCTGFRKDTEWITFPVAGDDGWPEQDRGRSLTHPGLYFVGLPFQFAFASMLVGGVGRDAAQVARLIDRTPVRQRTPELR